MNKGDLLTRYLRSQREGDLNLYLRRCREDLIDVAEETVKWLTQDHLSQKTKYFQSPEASYEGFLKLEEAQKAEIAATLRQPDIEIEQLQWACRSKVAGVDLGPVKEFLASNNMSWWFSLSGAKYLLGHLDKKLKPIDKGTERFWAGNVRQCRKCALKLIYDQGMYEPKRCAVLECDWRISE